MVNINKYLRNLKPYKVASHKLWKVNPKERGTLLKLDWNEATCGSSPLVKARLKSLIENDYLNYYPDTSNDQLYTLLSGYLNLPKENIQYFGSSDSLHEYISRLYVSQGDKVLILWPSYDNLRLTMQVSGAEVCFFEMEEDFTFNTKKFEEEIANLHPKLVYICNPNNPTGGVLDKDYIHTLASRFRETIFLIDEAYIEFCEEYTCKDLVLEYDNILISRTTSKAFGLANIRFGYVIASSENIAALSNIRNPKNITTFAQEAVIGALLDLPHTKRYIEEVKNARDYFITTINSRFNGKLKAFESHGNFVLVNCRDECMKAALLSHLESKNIFIRAVGQSETLKKSVRITIGTLPQMKRVVHAISDFFTIRQ